MEVALRIESRMTAVYLWVHNISISYWLEFQTHSICNSKETCAIKISQFNSETSGSQPPCRNTSRAACSRLFTTQCTLESISLLLFHNSIIVGKHMTRKIALKFHSNEVFFIAIIWNASRITTSNFKILNCSRRRGRSKDWFLKYLVATNPITDYSKGWIDRSRNTKSQLYFNPTDNLPRSSKR